MEYTELDRILMTHHAHTLTNFEIQTYCQNEPKFKGVYSRNDLPGTIKDKAYVINLDE